MHTTVAALFSEKVLIFFLILMDIVLILTGESLAYLIKFKNFDTVPTQYILLALASCCIFSISTASASGYKVKNYFNIDTCLAVVTKSGLVSLFIISLICISFKISSDYSRDWYFYSTVLTASALYTGRLVLIFANNLIGIKKQFVERAVIFGMCDLSEMLVKQWKESDDNSFEIVGVFDDRKTRLSEGSSSALYLGGSDKLLDYIRTSVVDRVIITLPWGAHDRISSLLDQLRILPVKIDNCLPAFMWGLPVNNVHRLGNIPMVTLANPSISRDTRLIKSIEDYLIGTLLFILMLPIMAAIAIAIRLDSPGPILFKQERNGFNNTVFTVYKFRTMYNQENGAEIKQATPDDPRVTRVGRLLRRLSLDELPQILNVLGGTMSIVGPRPHVAQHNLMFSKDIKAYFARHNMKPGITGLAQINGFRGEITSNSALQARIKYDMQYLDNWSLWLDLKIILLTAVKVWFQKQAY